ncbi:hypothetical protein [Streptomyces achromogenes]|uniref:hypothetical protein n=1 Tax=Streptomyces achromogenes TaxID=67255 RepID=UPI0036BD8604
MSAESPTPPPSYLSALAAVLHSTPDREARARLYMKLADEALALAAEAPADDVRWMWLNLHEDLYSKAEALRLPAKPRRGWFR